MRTEFDHCDKIMYNMRELQQVLGIGKNLAYELVAIPSFPKITINNRYYIPCEQLREWVQKNRNREITTK